MVGFLFRGLMSPPFSKTVPFLLLIISFLMGKGLMAANSLSFESIVIASHPKGWSYAHKTVFANGNISGAHLSGSPEAPRVYESKDKLKPEDLQKFNHPVIVIKTKNLVSDKKPDQSVEGYKSVTLVIDKNTSLSFYAPWEGEFKIKEVQSLWDLIYAYKVGAW